MACSSSEPAFWPGTSSRSRRRPAHLQRALFVDGLTTADSVSDVSGRGVGMGALLEGIMALGGELAIETELGKGTTLRMTFPQSSARSLSTISAAA